MPKRKLSEAAKRRLSGDPLIRSKRMAYIAKLRHSRLTPEERKAQAAVMVNARRLKRLARIAGDGSSPSLLG